MKISTLLVLLGLACPTVLAQRYVFNRADYATSATAVAVALADFNGDGRLDMAVVNQAAPGSSTVSILLGKPDGTFEESSAECPIGFPCKITQFAVGGTPYSIAVGDFNGDGKLDLVVADGVANTVSVLMGNGDGTFQAAVDYETGNFPYSVVIGDFNGDKKLDLVVTNDQDSTVSTLLGNGDGTFQAHQDFTTGRLPCPAVIGDFNGDNKLDLATANSDGTVSILLGNGDGTFQTNQDYAAATDCGGLTAGDFNRDGKLDLVATGQNNISILLGNGDGTFKTPVSYPVGSGPISVTSGDLNGDGKLDLATNSGSNIVSVLLGNGDGTFKTAVTYGVGSPVSGDVGANAPASVAVGDVNGDGSLDLAVANAGVSTVSVLIGNGDGTFAKESSAKLKFLAKAVTTGDFTGSGKPDLAVAVAESQVDVFLGNNQGKFQTSVAYSTGENNEPTAVVTADFNGDGRLDLATADSDSGLVSILFGNGDGTFQTNVDYSIGRVNNDVGSLAVGDFNGDGYLDLAVQSGSAVAILLNNGNGTFQPATFPIFFPPPLSGVGGMAVGDFNGDGKADLALTGTNSSNNTSSVFILLGNGDGTFNVANANSYPTAPYPGFVAVVKDADGKLDLAIGCQSDTTSIVLLPGIVSILKGNGDGTFQPHVDYQLGTNTGTAQLAIGDWNGDGKPDIGVVTGNSSTFSILLGNGDGTFQSHIDYLTPEQPISLAAAGLDLAVTSPNTVSVFLNSPVIALFPNALSFGNQALDTSASQTITVSNSGSAPLSMSSITVTSDFTETNDCGPSLAPGSNCTVTVTFKPTAKETYTGKLTFTDGAATGHQTLSLQGTGIQPAVKLSTKTLAFGNQTIGNTSAPKSVTLTNTGNETLTIASIAITGVDAGDFSETETCGSSLATGASCKISVTFKPEAKGARSAAISVTDNAAGSPRKVTLAGTGQ